MLSFPRSTKGAVCNVYVVWLSQVSSTFEFCGCSAGPLPLTSTHLFFVTSFGSWIFKLFVDFSPHKSEYCWMMEEYAVFLALSKWYVRFLNCVGFFGFSHVDIQLWVFWMSRGTFFFFFYILWKLGLHGFSFLSLYQYFLSLQLQTLSTQQRFYFLFLARFGNCCFLRGHWQYSVRPSGTAGNLGSLRGDCSSFVEICWEKKTARLKMPT